MGQTKSFISIAYLLLLSVLNVLASSKFDLPVAKIYEVDENDKISRPWEKIENSEAVIEGVNSLRLECSANHPVQWIYSGNGIPVSSSKITFSRNRVSKEVETVHQATVFINPLKEHHTGKYQCSSTEILDLETYFYIYVPGQALFTSLNGKNIRIDKNNTKVIIPCTVSNPNAVVTLEKQVGQVLQEFQPKSSDGVTYNPRIGFTIKLDELTEESEGIFVCTAKFNNLVRGVEYTLSSHNHFNTFQPESSNSACSNHKCGDNAICIMVGEHPTCQCEESFIGDAEDFCSLKCEAHTDCPDNKSCFTDKECRSPCIHSVVGCGINSLCKVENHRPICYCGPDFLGDPMQQCFSTLQGSQPDAPSAGDDEKPSNDNPGSGSTKCKSSDDCKIDEQCRRIGVSLECVDGCMFVQCGLNSKCSMVNHNPYCSCQPGFNGDPYSECGPVKIEAAEEEKLQADPTSVNKTEPCQNPENCGPYSKCRINKRGRERCSCKNGYLGQPPNCTSTKCDQNRDCQMNQVCSNSNSNSGHIGSPVCLNICGSRVCGEGAECYGACRCPPGFVGAPYTKCTDISKKVNTDCTIDNDCGDVLRCETGATYRKCVDPCAEFKCNSGTTCLTEKHEAKCVCPHGFTGNSIIGCIPDFNVEIFRGRTERSSSDTNCSTLSCGPNSECRLVEGEPTCFCQSGFIGSSPFCRSECEANVDCPMDQTCVQKKCRSACLNKCGKNTTCRVIPSLERSPVCSCLEGHTGNPSVGCLPNNS